MALKLRRRAGTFTNRMLAHESSRRDPGRLSTGAASFKRVLGRTPSGRAVPTYGEGSATGDPPRALRG